MKRFLLVIPILLLVLLNACTGDPASAAATQTAVVQTQTAKAWTPTPGPVPTQDYISPIIFDYLNRAMEELEVSDKFNQLEHLTGASYQVVGVNFRTRNDVPAIFHIDIRCECATNAQCCSSTRTFVMALRAMEKYKDEITSYVYNIGPITTMEVQCYDHANQTVVMSVPWADVTSFLFDQTNSPGTGYLLASKVTPEAQP